MTRSLQMNQSHDRDKAADVKARRGRIESDIPGHLALAQRVTNLLGVLEEQIPPFELVEQRLRSHGTKLDEVGGKVLRHSALTRGPSLASHHTSSPCSSESF